MKKSMDSKFLIAVATTLIATGLLAGCGSEPEPEAVVNTESIEPVEDTTSDDQSGDTAPTDTQDSTETGSDTADTAGTCFEKGVYLYYPVDDDNAALDDFCIFYDPNTGYIDNGTTRESAPFYAEYGDGTVTFNMGGALNTVEVFTVESVEDRAVTGHFEDGVKLIFTPVMDEEPDTFNAYNYVNGAAGGNSLYEDANGWSVKYDPSLITVNRGDAVTTFVYIGESAGTNMLTATYTVDKDAKTAIDDLAKTWGDTAFITEGPFPGTENVDGYFVTLPPAEGGSGLYMSALARDYMDGALVFELTGHNGEDEEMNMAVSDVMAGIMDSIEFQDEAK